MAVFHKIRLGRQGQISPADSDDAADAHHPGDLPELDRAVERISVDAEKLCRFINGQKLRKRGHGEPLEATGWSRLPTGEAPPATAA